MFGRRWQLFRLRGIPISIDASWLVILALVTLSMAADVFPGLMRQFYPDRPPLRAPAYWVTGLVAALTFFVCVVLHELGHATVARARGMTIRGITLFLFGGVAEIGDEPPSAGTEFAMAIAGPLVSLVLGIAFSLVAGAGRAAGWPPAVVLVLGYVGFVNLLVLVFNLIPAFPLDGGRVLRSLLWAVTGNLRRATRWASFAGQAFAWLLIAWGVYQLFAGQWLGGIWSGLIGMFLNNAAKSSYQQVVVRQALQGERVRHFMNPQPIVVPPSLNLRQWVEDYVYRYHRKMFPVVSGDHLEGVISTRTLADLPRSEWELHTVGDVMRRDLDALTIPPQADALDALARMQRLGVSRLLVTEADRLVGIVSLKDLLRFLNLKLDLEGPAEESVPAGAPEEPGRGQTDRYADDHSAPSDAADHPLGAR